MTTTTSDERDIARTRLAGGLTPIEAMAFLGAVIVIALLTGIYSRYPYLDETGSIGQISGKDISGIFLDLVGAYDDVPPGFFVLFGFFGHIGITYVEMRFISLIMTAFAFLFILDVTLSVLSNVSYVRQSAIFIFATFPLFYGVGDALRWYPLFALLIALFFWLDIRFHGPTIGGGLALGLAASTNFIAVLPYAAFAVRRYWLQRRFALGRDGLFHLAILATVWPGLWAIESIIEKGGVGWADYHLAPLNTVQRISAVTRVLLGFFGGSRIGLPESPAILPYLGILALGAVRFFANRKQRSQGSEPQFALLFYAGFLSALSIVWSFFSGYFASYAFLFIAPFVISALVIGYWPSPLSRSNPFPIIVAACLMFGAALRDWHMSEHPFVRDDALPFAEVEKFVADNTDGNVYFVSSNITSAYLMGTAGYCVSNLTDTYGSQPCETNALSAFHYIAIAHAQTGQPNFEADLAKAEEALLHGRMLTAKAHFGLDGTAALKSKLTGLPKDEWLLEVDIYR